MYVHCTNYAAFTHWNNIQWLKWIQCPDMCYNLDESWRYDAKWNQPDTEEQMLYDSTDMKYLE